MTPFFKLSGGGNDFIALAEPEADPAPDTVVRWCTRGLSEGADGLFVLRREDVGVRMVYSNSDGRRAALCLNGTRCAARLAFHLGWAKDRVAVSTDAGAFEAAAAGDNAVQLRLPNPQGPPEPLRLTVDDETISAILIDVGVPHLVLFQDEDMSQAPIDRLGPRLRGHPDLTPAGANVDFARFPEPHRLELRSWERGVEAETLACGTGVLACIAIGLDLGLAELPVKAVTLGGFEIEVAPSETPSHWLMTGDARVVCGGTLAPEAAVAPVPPAWR